MLGCGVVHSKPEGLPRSAKYEVGFRPTSRADRASAGGTGMGPLAGSTTTAPPIPWEPASNPFPFHLLSARSQEENCGTGRAPKAECQEWCGAGSYTRSRRGSPVPLNTKLAFD